MDPIGSVGMFLSRRKATSWVLILGAVMTGAAMGVSGEGPDVATASAPAVLRAEDLGYEARALAWSDASTSKSGKRAFRIDFFATKGDSTPWNGEGTDHVMFIDGQPVPLRLET